MRAPRHCKEDEPDCLNCPFPDCIATMEDINRQNRIQTEKERQEEMRKRNEQILGLYKEGFDVITIGERFNLTRNRVYHIINHYK